MSIDPQLCAGSGYGNALRTPSARITVTRSTLQVSSANHTQTFINGVVDLALEALISVGDS
jgi:hypothetical protein